MKGNHSCGGNIHSKCPMWVVVVGTKDLLCSGNKAKLNWSIMWVDAIIFIGIYLLCTGNQIR